VDCLDTGWGDEDRKGDGEPEDGRSQFALGRSGGDAGAQAEFGKSGDVVRQRDSPFAPGDDGVVDGAWESLPGAALCLGNGLEPLACTSHIPSLNRYGARAAG
jgi:hypothetical protein